MFVEKLPPLFLKRELFVSYGSVIGVDERCSLKKAIQWLILNLNARISKYSNMQAGLPSNATPDFICLGADYEHDYVYLENKVGCMPTLIVKGTFPPSISHLPLHAKSGELFLALLRWFNLHNFSVLGKYMTPDFGTVMLHSAVLGINIRLSWGGSSVEEVSLDDLSLMGIDSADSLPEGTAISQVGSESTMSKIFVGDDGPGYED